MRNLSRFLVVVIFSTWICRGDGATNDAAANQPALYAEHCTQKTIYHSPQKPGYTCWVGEWIMADKSIMVTFQQATGPLTNRPRSLDFFKQIGDTWTPAHPSYDYTGLELAHVYLRSTDQGTTWVTAAEDKFSGPIDRPTWGGSHVGLADNSILRAEDGSQLPFVPDLPRQIYFRRSHDFGKTWGAPEIPPEPKRPIAGKLGDVGDCISRVRHLSDGELIATGVARPDPNDREAGKPVVMFSKDEGHTWAVQKLILPEGIGTKGSWNEWDCMEVPNGDLVAVFRRADPATHKQGRWQGIFKKSGENTWTLEDYHRSILKHSGHPELLYAKEGVLLHIAATGIYWTDNEGKTWHLLTTADGKPVPPTHYYPKSVQTDDGTILVCSHRGSDNGYGDSDQSIVLDTFRLVKR